jgi:hypothetical protein
VSSNLTLSAKEVFSDAAIREAEARKRLRNRVQITTDGRKACLEAIEGAFGADVD